MNVKPYDIYQKFKEELGQIDPYVRQINDCYDESVCQFTHFGQHLFLDITSNVNEIIEPYQIITITYYIELMLDEIMLSLSTNLLNAMKEFFKSNTNKIISKLTQETCQKLVKEFIKVSNNINTDDLMVLISYYVIPYLQHISVDEEILLLVTFSPIDYVYFTQVITQMLKDNKNNRDTVLINLILQIVINILQPIGYIQQNITMLLQQKQNPGNYFFPMCLIVSRKRFIGPSFCQFLSSDIIQQMQNVILKEITYDFLIDKIYQQITFGCQLSTPKQQMPIPDDPEQLIIDLQNMDANEIQLSLDLENVNENVQLEEQPINDVQNNNEDDSNYVYLLSTAEPDPLKFPEILPQFNRKIYFNGLFSAVYKQIHTQICIKNTNIFDPVQLINIFIFYHDLQTQYDNNGFLFQENKNNVIGQHNEQDILSQYICIRDDHLCNNDPNAIHSQQDPNKQIQYLSSENKYCTLSYYILSLSMIKPSTELKQQQKLVVPCQSLVSFCKQCKMQEDGYNEILDLLEFEKSEQFLLLDTQLRYNDSFNPNIKQNYVSSIFAFTSILLQMYGLNTLEIYAATLAFTLYQSKENFWLFLHKIPIHIFYLEESIKRAKLQQLLLNFYLFMLNMLNDQVSIIKKFVLYQYLYETTNNQQYFNKVQSLMREVQEIRDIKHLPPQSLTDNDIELLILIATYQYYTPAQNIIKIKDYIEKLLKSKVKLDQLFFMYCEQFLLLSKQEQTDNQIVFISYKVQSDVLGKFLKQLEGKPIYKFLHNQIQCFKSQHSQIIIQMLAKYALCHGHDNYSLIMFYNALDVDLENFILVQMFVNLRSKKFQIKKTQKSASHNSLFIDLLYQKPIHLKDERWKQFESIDIEQLTQEPIKSKLDQFNALRQEMQQVQPENQQK